MIQEVSGDILLTKAQAIAHGIAPNDHFSSGLALALREMWPSMYQDFRHYCHTTHPKPGGAWSWGGADGKRVINLLTQEVPPNHQANPGKASIHNLNHALKELRHLVEKEKFASLAVPRLATGVGGLDWEEVYPLIKKHLGDLKIPIFVYATYRAGEHAHETM